MHYVYNYTCRQSNTLQISQLSPVQTGSVTQPQPSTLEWCPRAGVDHENATTPLQNMTLLADHMYSPTSTSAQTLHLPFVFKRTNDDAIQDRAWVQSTDN